jgi:UDP-N-acetylglucosamine 2-epimerase
LAPPIKLLLIQFIPSFAEATAGRQYLASPNSLRSIQFIQFIQFIPMLEGQQRNNLRTLRAVNDYSMPNVSDKVVRIILSYTDYVNRVVWRE